MRISSYNQVNNYYQTSDKKSYPNSQDTKINTNFQSKEEANNDIWKKLSERFDVRNATFDDICEIGRELYKAKEISLLELGHITLDVSKLPGVKENSDISLFYKGKKDWIKAFEERAKNQLSYGNMSGYNAFMKSASYLKKISK